MLQLDFVDWRLSRVIRSEYPQPIAYRFVLLSNEVNTGEPDWFKAAHLMIDLGEIVTQYSSAIAIQSYTQADDIKSDKVNQKIRSLKEKPFSLRDWCELLRETLRCFIGHKDRLFIPELLSFYWQSPKEKMTKTAAFLDRLSRLGHGWMKEDSNEFVKENIPHVGMMLSELDFLGKYLLFVSDEKEENSYNIIIFDGHGKPISKSIETQSQLNLKDAYIVSAENLGVGNFDEVLCLSPLVVYEECLECSIKVARKENQIFLFQSYEEDQKKPMKYMAPLCGHQIYIDTHVGKFAIVIAGFLPPSFKKNWDELLELGDNNTKKSISEVSKKYNPEMYVHRGVEAQFDEFLKSEKTVFALLGEAGTGKTNLMCHLAEKCRDYGNVVVYFNCGSLDSLNLDQTIGETFDSRVLLKDIAENIDATAMQMGKRVIIFFDGVNEFEYSGEPLEFIKNFNALIKEHSEFKNIKFVFSCRTFFWEDLTASRSMPLYEDAFFTSDDGEIFVKLEKYGDDELSVALDKYLKVQADSVSDEFKITCSDPLILNLISETYAPGEIPTDTFSWRVMEAYCDKFVPTNDLGAQKFIDLLINEMRKNRATEVNLRMLDNDRLERMIIDDGQNQIYKRLIDDGIIRSAGYKGMKVCFNYDRVFEYFLGEALLIENDGRLSKEMILNSIKESEYFPTLWGGLKIACMKEWDERLFVDISASDDQRVTEFAVDTLTAIGSEDREKISEFLKNKLMKSRFDDAKRVAIYTAYNLGDAEVLKAGVRDKSELIRAIATQHLHYFWQHNRDEGFQVYTDICSKASLTNPRAIEAGLSLGFFTYADNWQDPDFVSTIQPICKNNLERLLGVKEGDSGIVKLIKDGARQSFFTIVTSFISRTMRTITKYNYINIPEMDEFFKLPESEKKNLIEMAKYGTLEKTDIESDADALLELALQKNALSCMLAGLIPLAQSAEDMQGVKRTLKRLYEHPDPYVMEITNAAVFRILLCQEKVDEDLLDILGKGVRKGFRGCYNSNIGRYWTIAPSAYAAAYTRFYKVAEIPIIEELIDLARKTAQDDEGTLLAHMIENVGYFLGAFWGYYDVALQMLERLAIEYLHSNDLEPPIQKKAVDAIVKGLVAMRIHHPGDVYRFLKQIEAPVDFVEKVKHAPARETFGDLMQVKSNTYFLKIIYYSPHLRNELFQTIAAAANCKGTADWIKYAARALVRLVCGEDYLK